MAVDDQPSNLKLLEDLLSQQGHVVRSFPRGRLALEAAIRNPPDLVLLDIDMPEMSGFRVCELLKSDDKLAAIPVIFLSALTDSGDKVRAFQCGGVDYVTKPFQVDEVQARLCNGAESANVSGILRNVGLEQDDVQHRASV